MTEKIKQKTMSKQEAINELRQQAQLLNDKPCSIKEYVSNTYRAKIRRKLADKFEAELKKDNKK